MSLPAGGSELNELWAPTATMLADLAHPWPRRAHVRALRNADRPARDGVGVGARDGMDADGPIACVVHGHEPLVGASCSARLWPT